MTRSILLSLAAAVALAQQPGGGSPVLAPQQLKPGLFVIMGGGATTLIRMASDGLIVVDSKNPGVQNYTPMMQQIENLSKLPIKFLIVTHHHADHTGNNAKFAAEAIPIVGHENVKTNLLSYKAVTPVPTAPNVTYEKDHLIRSGGVTVELHHYGRSHTNGDSVVYFPDLRLVAVSDTVTSGQGPLIDYAGGGSATEWIDVLDNILKLEFDVCVPGAGPVMTKNEVRAYRDKFQTVLTRARDLVKGGIAKEQLLGMIKVDDIGWSLRVPGDIAPFYDEISKMK